MAFLQDIFGRMGRVARGQANAGVDAMEDATFEATVRQTVADMKTELNNVVRASAGGVRQIRPAIPGVERPGGNGVGRRQ
jgi:phage shock protein A